MGEELVNIPGMQKKHHATSAGIKDVAKAANVSPATVSRVLGHGPVSDALRRRVEAAIKQTGYLPNLSARRLRSQNTRTIGLIVADIRNPFFTAVSRVVEDMAYADGMRVVLCNTDENPLREEFYLRSMQEERVSGLILTPTRKLLKKLGELPMLDVPTVLVDRSAAGLGYDAVVIDNVHASIHLVDHLVEQGFKRIAGVFGNSSGTGQDRYDGYVQAVQAHGLPNLSRFLRPYAAEAQSCFDDLWKEVRPDAVIASNSLFAAGLLRAMHNHKLRIPEDIALATFDDEPWTSLVEPALTVVAQPVAQIGHDAMQLLSGRIHEPSAEPRTMQLAAHLIVRDSTLRRSASPA